MLTRSTDGGDSWSEPKPIWPKIKDYSIFGSISIDKNDTLYFYGTRTKIEAIGESFWQEKNQGIKQN